MKLLTRHLKTFSRSTKQFYPAAGRNAEPILQILKKWLDADRPNLELLEISSGTGQHAAHFSKNYPNIRFQPTEFEECLLPSIAAYAADSEHGNVLPPFRVDVRDDFFPDQKEKYDYILNVNMIHVSPWPCTVGLFRNAARLLKKGGLIFTYGAYAVDGVVEPESNRQFDKEIRSRNPEFGIRDTRDIKTVASKYGIRFVEMYDMPANNKSIVWQKE